MTASAAAAAAMESQIIAAGKPYAPMYMGLGADPGVIPDAPVAAVFLVLFLIAAITNVSIFVKNKKKGHKFGFSMAMNAFCCIRVVSCALRIAWSCHPQNVKLAMAAEICVFAGVIILYIVGLFLAQRSMRARHPRLGWSLLFKVVFPPVIVAITVVSVLLVIIASLQSFYTLNPNTLRIDRDIQIYVETMFTAVAFLPIPVIVIMIIIPRRTYIDKFGAGRFRTKVALLAGSSALLTLGAGFRCAIAWLPPVLRTAATPWYLSTACFYIFNFGIEVTVIYAYLVARIDRRFYVPDGSDGPGSYAGDPLDDKPRLWPSSVYLVAREGSTWDGNASTDGVPLRSRSVKSVSAQSFLEVNPNTGEYYIRTPRQSMSRRSHQSTATRSVAQFEPSTEQGFA